MKIVKIKLRFAIDAKAWAAYISIHDPAFRIVKRLSGEEPKGSTMREAKVRGRQDASTPQYSVRAVERAMALLGVFSIQRPEISLAEISREAKLSKATTFRLLHTLEKGHFVTFDASRSKYRLGPKLLELGGIALSSLTLRTAARQHLNLLHEETGATVLMCILLDNHLVYVDKREGKGPIRIASDIGWRRVPHFGMLGKTLLAYLPKDEIEKILDLYPLEPHTRHSVVDRREFVSRLESIRQRGYELEFDEAVEGLWGVAAPIYDSTAKVVASVGSSLPKSEATSERIHQVMEAVTRCAANISISLGYSESLASSVALHVAASTPSAPRNME